MQYEGSTWRQIEGKVGDYSNSTHYKYVADLDITDKDSNPKFVFDVDATKTKAEPEVYALNVIAGDYGGACISTSIAIVIVCVDCAGGISYCLQKQHRNLRPMWMLQVG